MRHSRKGFTLIELMIVVAIIALIAAFAIPALLRARITANETGAIAALRSLATNQAQFQAVSVVDQDEDGTGEYGLFQELTGADDPRWPNSGNNGPAQRRPGEFMAQIFGDVNANGHSTKSGYLYVIYLPDTAALDTWNPGDPVVDDSDLTPGAVMGATDEAIDDQEVHYCAYAWPVMRERTGNRVFFVDTDGTIYFTINDDGSPTPYSGTAAFPVAGAAYVAGGEIAMPDADAGETGIDTNVWLPLSD